MSKTIEINRSTVLKYALTPQVLPRIRDLFGTGFYHIAYYIALVYSAVRLLPANHPYAQVQNIGRFGVRHVVAEAANSLQVSKENYDKIFVFLLVMLGIAIGFVQIFILVIGLFMQTAHAAGISDYFTTENAAQDLAFMFMDLVFGVEGVFKSCVSTSVACKDLNGATAADAAFNAISGGRFPYPMHSALHKMLSLYSTGLLMVAVLIVTYFVATVVAETAQTGTPFGKRFSHLWAPLRIVVAFALLMPIGTGLNAAQYLVLYSAKFGSGFATNGWKKFNDTLNEEYVTDEKALLAKPKSPDITSLLRFLFIAKTCAYNYEYTKQGFSSAGEEGSKLDVRPYLVSTRYVKDTSLPSVLEVTMGDPLTLADNDIEAETEGTPYYVKPDEVKEDNVGFWNFANGASSVELVFGVLNESKYAGYKGKVKPVCGKMQFTFSDPRTPYPHSGTVDPDVNYASPGVDLLQRYYWQITKIAYFTNEYFFHSASGNHDTAWVLAGEYSGIANKIPDAIKIENDDDFPGLAFNWFNGDVQTILKGDCSGGSDYVDEYGSCGFLQSAFYDVGVLPANKNVIGLEETQNHQGLDTHVINKGWAAAGVWYNKVAEINGVVTESIGNVPAIVSYPMVMEHIYRQNKKFYQNVSFKDAYKPGPKVKLSTVKELSEFKYLGEHAKAMNEAYSLWPADISSSYMTPSGNAFVDTVMSIFGAEGLINLRENSDVHPLAALSGMGKTLVDSSIRNIGYIGLLKSGNAITETLSGMLGSAVATSANFVTSVAMTALTMGFILYYVVPFMPFVYFFFAVTGWVKGIFEALVGVPLWALAHIRIDGNGLPGQAAMNGYYLLFEIFIRPLLTIFGLLASLSIFAALVSVLADVWGVVIENAGGYDMESALNSATSGTANTLNIENAGSAVDQFFYTIVYAIVVYMIGMSSFKLIDAIPNNILRWMGASVAAFNDGRENPAEGVAGSSYRGLTQVTPELENMFTMKSK